MKGLRRNPNDPPVHSRFKPGQSGNPEGKPTGSRNRLSHKFLFELAEDFEEHGKRVIEAARIESPVKYLTIVASVLPKQVEQVKALDTMSDDEIAAAIDELRDRITARIGERAGDSAAAESLN